MQVAVKNRLQRMDDYDFEYFVGDLWERMGWECNVSQASVDAGIDVVATKPNPYPQKTIIQAKRYGPNTTVSGPAIQQYASLKQQESGVDSVVIATTNTFTRAAEKRAEELNVKLVDGDDLVSMVDELGAEDLLEQYDIGEVEGTQSDNETQSAQSHASAIASAESEDGLLARAVRARDWYSTLLKATGLAFTALLIGVLSDGTNIGFLGAVNSAAETVFGILLIVVAVALYLDIRYVRRHSSWNPTTWLYLVGLFFFYITVPVYLYRRREAI